MGGWLWILVILAGLGVVRRRWGRQAVLSLGLLVFVWALLRHLPIVAADALLGGSWTRAGKALTFVGGSFAVAGTLPPIPGETRGRLAALCEHDRAVRQVWRDLLGCFLIIAGLQHFKFTAFVVTLIPAWFPGNATWWVRFAGVALIAGGLGLLVQAHRGARRADDWTDDLFVVLDRASAEDVHQRKRRNRGIRSAGVFGDRAGRRWCSRQGRGRRSAGRGVIRAVER